MMQRTFRWDASGMPDNRVAGEALDRRIILADRPESARDTSHPTVPLPDGALPDGALPAVALIDPKALTRGSIGALLATAFPACEMLVTSTCEELLDTTDIGRLQLVLIYIRSEGLTATWVQSALALLRMRLPEVSTVVLSDEDGVDVGQALALGARGYIPTSVERDVAVAALRLVGAGGTFVPASSYRPTAARMDDRADLGRRRSPDGPGLTPRERSVIDLLREGKPNKLIARQLNMQESTVKVHVSNILRKLNAANRTHAAFVVNRLLGQGAQPTSSQTPSNAQGPGTAKR